MSALLEAIVMDHEFEMGQPTPAAPVPMGFVTVIPATDGGPGWQVQTLIGDSVDIYPPIFDSTTDAERKAARISLRRGLDLWLAQDASGAWAAYLIEQALHEDEEEARANAWQL